MIARFQIEDLIVQDTAGVTFRAVDTVTQMPVAVRRFFPFGADGGGLQKEEEVAYNIAVGRLAGVRHPQLRAVITGGCDPIDSMPYIATEWVDGALLSEIVHNGPLSAEDAVSLACSALEVCELLSQVLAEEAIWVETGLHTIIVADPTANRGATFWISPLKWLGGSQARGYEAIVDMMEDAMDWKGRVVGDHAGRGLGAWLKWLRTVPANMPLREVRKSLAAALGAEPPAVVPESPESAPVSRTPTMRGVTQQMISPEQPTPSAHAGRKWLLLISAVVVLAIAGVAVWWFTRQDPAAAAPDVQPDRPMTDLERVNRRAVELRAQADLGNPPKPAPATARAATSVPGVIPWDKRDTLIGHDKQTVTISGLVSKTAMSNSGKTIYLLFSDDPGSARVGFLLEGDARGAAEKRFGSLIGKKVACVGTVRYNATIGNRPEIIINSLNDVKSVD